MIYYFIFIAYAKQETRNIFLEHVISKSEASDEYSTIDVLFSYCLVWNRDQLSVENLKVLDFMNSIYKPYLIREVVESDPKFWIQKFKKEILNIKDFLEPFLQYFKTNNKAVERYRDQLYRNFDLISSEASTLLLNRFLKKIKVYLQACVLKLCEIEKNELISIYRHLKLKSVKYQHTQMKIKDNFHTHIDEFLRTSLKAVELELKRYFAPIFNDFYRHLQLLQYHFRLYGIHPYPSIFYLTRLNRFKDFVEEFLRQDLTKNILESKEYHNFVNNIAFDLNNLRNFIFVKFIDEFTTF